MKINKCPICGREQLIRNNEYEDEYYCRCCQLSFEIMLINETGKEVVDKGVEQGND